MRELVGSEYRPPSDTRESSTWPTSLEAAIASSEGEGDGGELADGGDAEVPAPGALEPNASAEPAREPDHSADSSWTGIASGAGTCEVG